MGDATAMFSAGRITTTGLVPALRSRQCWFSLLVKQIPLFGQAASVLQVDDPEGAELSGHLPGVLVLRPAVLSASGGAGPQIRPTGCGIIFVVPAVRSGADGAGGGVGAKGLTCS